MKEIFGYSESNIEIAVLSSDTEEEWLKNSDKEVKWLKIDYVIRLRTSEGVYELTAADYYYEALELMLIYSDNENRKNNENREHISNLIQLIDQFRNLIYSTLTEEKNDLKEVRYITTISNYLKISFINFFETKSLN